MKKIALYLMVGFFLVFSVSCGTSHTISDSSDHDDAQATAGTHKIHVDRLKDTTLFSENDGAIDGEKSGSGVDDSESQENSNHNDTKQDNNNISDDADDAQRNKQADRNAARSSDNSTSHSNQLTDSSGTNKSSKTSKPQDSNKDNRKEKDESTPHDSSKSIKDQKSNNQKDNHNNSDEKSEAPQKTVTVEVTTGEVKGTILSKTKVPLQDGDTVLDVTKRILKEKGIPINIRGSKGSAYVVGIDSLEEMDEGPESGWHIRVDGIMIDRSAGIWDIKAGDSINWNYTVNWMEDSEDW